MSTQPDILPHRARSRLSRMLTSLNPLETFFGPVFQKEVRVLGRRISTYWIRSLVALAMVAIVGLFYLAAQDDLRHSGGVGSSAATIQRTQQIAPALALAVGWSQLALLMFLAPVLTAPAISAERRARTLPALMTTPLTSSQIVLGKLSSSLVTLLLVAFMSLPLLLSVRLFGGLDAQVPIATTSISLSAAILVASIGLLFSLWHPRPGSAAVFAFLTMIMLTLAVAAVISWYASRAVGGPTLPFPAWLLKVNPFIAMGVVTAIVMGGVPIADLTDLWVTNTIVNLSLAAAVCVTTTLVMRRILRSEAAFNPLPEKKPRRARKRAAVAAPVPPDAESSAPPEPAAQPAETIELEGGHRRVGDHPVLWRELRQNPFGTRTRFLIMLSAALLGMGWLYWQVGIDEEAVNMMIGLIGIGAFCFTACLATTGAVASEREDRTWGVLLTTPIGMREVLLSKLVGGLARQWLAPALVGAHMLIAIATGSVHPLILVLLPPLAIGAATLLGGTGLALSCLCKRSTTATILNIGLAFALWAGLPFLAVFSDEVLDLWSGHSHPFAWRAVLGINPIFMTGAATDGCNTLTRRREFGKVFDFPDENIGVGAFVLLVMLGSAFNFLAGLLAMAFAELLLRRRAEQAV